MKKSNNPILKQSLIYSLFSYLGTIIGTLATLLLYANNTEYYGKFRYIISTATLLIPILTLGTNAAIIKFYPRLKSEGNLDFFFTRIILIILLNSLIIGLLLYGFKLFNPRVFLLKNNYIFHGLCLATILSLFLILKNLLSNLKLISIPAILEKTLTKLLLSGIFIGSLYLGLSEENGIYTFLIGWLFLLFTLALYSKSKMGIKLKIHLEDGSLDFKPIAKFSLFSMASSLGAILAFKIDELMIPHLIPNGFDANGIYGIGVNLAMTLAVPSAALFSIYAPIVNRQLQKNEFAIIKTNYHKLSLYLFLIIGVLLGCIYLGIHDLFLLINASDKLVESIPILLILGFNIWVDKSFSFNSELINYSKYYPFNLVAILLLGISNISLNYLFIKVFNYGIEGAACASLLSLSLFNISKCLFIYSRYKLFPFGRNHFILGSLLIPLFIGIDQGITMDSPLLNILVRIGLFLSISVLIIYLWKDKLGLSFKK